MLFSRSQLTSLVLLCFKIAPALTLDLDSIESSIENGVESIGSDISNGATKLLGDLSADFDDFQKSVTSELSSLVVGAGGVLSQFVIGHQTTPPVSTKLSSSGVQANVTVGLYCESCDNSTQPAAFDFARQSYSGYNDSWLGFALESFDALIEVEIDLTAVTSGEISLSLFKLMAGADGVVVDVEFQLHLLANASASMSFVTGLNLSLINPAAIMMPALDPIVNLTDATSIGFDQSNFILTPIFESSMPTLAFDVQLSLRTGFSVSVENIDVGSLYLDLPAFNLGVSTVNNMLSNCQPPPAGTSPDNIYEQLIHLNGALDAVLSYELIGGSEQGIIDTWTIWDAIDNCYAFLPGTGVLGPVPPSSRSHLLTDIPVTTCTTGNGTTTSSGTKAVSESLRSLSPGAKAAIIVGTLCGVALVAAAAWFGGRASLKRSLQNNNTGSTSSHPAHMYSRQDSAGAGSAWVGKRHRKLFSRGKTTEFSKANPNTPAFQSTVNDQAIYDDSRPPMQSQLPSYHSGWQAAQKEPFIGVAEAVTPASTFVSAMSDDHGMPTVRGNDGDRISDHAGRYEAYRSLRSEASMTDQSSTRPAVQRKEVSRKAVPGLGFRGQGS